MRSAFRALIKIINAIRLRSVKFRKNIFSSFSGKNNLVKKRSKFIHGSMFQLILEIDIS